MAAPMQRVQPDRSLTILTSLCRDVDSAVCIRSCCEPVPPGDLPQGYQEALVHEDHMTTRLQACCNDRVVLNVLGDRLNGDIYRREILLTLAGSGEVVEYGVVRIDLCATGEDVRREILAKQQPLGDILIRHDVLRSINPYLYLKFQPESPVAAHFGARGASPCFGRLGTIYCNESPAIDLLEVVSLPGTGAVSD